MNSFSVLGRLGKDAEVRTTANGIKYIYFTMAENVRSGKETKTQWYNVTGYNFSDKLLPYLTKGKAVFITGSLSVDLEKKFIDVRANSFEFPNLGEKQNNGTVQDSTNKDKENTPEMEKGVQNVDEITMGKKSKPTPTPAQPTNEADDDLPF